MSEINKLLLDKIIKTLKAEDTWRLQKVDFTRKGLMNSELNILIMKEVDDKVRGVDVLYPSFEYIFLEAKEKSGGYNEYYTTDNYILPINMTWWDKFLFNRALKTQFKHIEMAGERATEKAAERKLLEFVNKNKSMNRELKLDNILEDE